MILNYTATIGNDFNNVCGRIIGSNIPDDPKQNEEQIEKVKYSAFRIFASLGMFLGVGFIGAASTALLTAAALPGTVLFGLASGVMLYALCHDLFRMCENYSCLIDDDLSLVAEMVNYGIKNPDFNPKAGESLPIDFAATLLSKNTFFAPLWMVLVKREKSTSPVQA